MQPEAFGMHYLGFGQHPFPKMPFGTARVWDMGVTWMDLLPNPSSRIDSANPVTARLDAIVRSFSARHVQPLLTLGMTPAWAARSCRHDIAGADWGVQTCAPKDTGPHGPWGNYVRALANRYAHSVRYFELWNEPSLLNGFNDPPAVLAQMQQTAHDVLKSLGHGQQLVAPSIPFTNGSIDNGLGWLDRFLSEPGGTSFDIAGFHLYPSDDSARSGMGPEWVFKRVLPEVRAVLAAHGLAHLPLWDTETNVGRVAAKVTFAGMPAAAMTARTFILATEQEVARTIWYAADDRNWGGTWLESPDYRSLTEAGLAESVVHDLIVGAQPTGCSLASGQQHYACGYLLPHGQHLLALWSTGPAYRVQVPANVRRITSTVGARLPVQRDGSIAIGASPIYLVSAAGS